MCDRVFRCESGYDGPRCDINKLDDFFERTSRKILYLSLMDNILPTMNSMQPS